MEDVAGTFRRKWGGSRKAWKHFIERLHHEKSHGEFSQIYKTLVETENASWLRRMKNTLFFTNISRMFRAIEAYHVTKIKLNQFKSWRQFNVHERRALLLFNFRKWWWDANSDHIEGFGRWFRASFIISEILLGKTPKGKLSDRLHELLGSDVNLSFFSNLFSHFASEIQIFKTVENDPGSRQILSENLKNRVIQLRRLGNIYKNQLSWSQKRYLEITVHRSEVLIALLKKGSPLTQKEMIDLGVNPKGAYALRISRVLSVTNDFIMQTAILIALGYLIETLFDKRVKNHTIKGSLKDFNFFNSDKKPD